MRLEKSLNLLRVAQLRFDGSGYEKKASFEDLNGGVNILVAIVLEVGQAMSQAFCMRQGRLPFDGKMVSVRIIYPLGGERKDVEGSMLE